MLVSFLLLRQKAYGKLRERKVHFVLGVQKFQGAVIWPCLLGPWQHSSLKSVRQRGLVAQHHGRKRNRKRLWTQYPLQEPTPAIPFLPGSHQFKVLPPLKVPLGPVCQHGPLTGMLIFTGVNFLFPISIDPQTTVSRPLAVRWVLWHGLFCPLESIDPLLSLPSTSTLQTTCPRRNSGPQLAVESARGKIDLY